MVVSMTISRIHVMIECLCGRGADIVRRHGHCDPSIVRASVAALAIKEYLITRLNYCHVVILKTVITMMKMTRPYPRIHHCLHVLVAVLSIKSTLSLVEPARKSTAIHKS